MSENYDVVVIGSGPGGQKASVEAAKAGKRVAIIDKDPRMGGSCVYQGTIPSKTLREAALTIDRLKRNAEVFNFSFQPGLEVASLMTRLDQVLEAHAAFIAEHFRSFGIEQMHGRAKLTGPRSLEVTTVSGETQTLESEFIVIATGSRPRTPPGIPVDHEHILDSDSILSMIYIPRSLTVLGGGVIACEYASIFQLLGVEVTMIDKAPRPLGFLDPELTDQFRLHFERHGGRFLGGEKIESVSWDGVSQVMANLESGEAVKSDKMLVALGRSANVERLGLETAGIEQNERGHIEVDEFYRTTLPGIYAVGDVIGPPSLAACSMEQGRRAICHALGLDMGSAFEVVPMGIYAVPELASVGMSEDQAREHYGDVVVGRAHYRELARGLIAGAEEGLLKLVADPSGKKLLGVQVVGDWATDVIHVGEMALLSGSDVSVFLENIMNFPTLGEAYRVAALDVLDAVRRKNAGLAAAA